MYFLLILNFRYFNFHTGLIDKIDQHRTELRFRLKKSEINFAYVWNIRLGKLVSLFGSKYTLCMKRAFVLAILIPRDERFFYRIAINKAEPKEGHAWLELNNIAVCETISPDKYFVVKEIEILIK